MALNGEERSNDTLLIRHLPVEFSENDNQEFLQHFGATSVKTVGHFKQNRLVYAKFPNPAVAKVALFRLHQLEVLGRFLNVQYARSNELVESSDFTSNSASKNSVKISNDDKRQELKNELLRRLIAWSSTLNLSQPPPPHLCYKYPAPTPQTLGNISRALLANPKLYTQLLHLMNRMNLPPPFQDEFAMSHISHQATQTDGVWVQDSNSSEEEEMELECNQEKELKTPENVYKRLRSLTKSKPIKRPRFIRPQKLVQSEVSRPLNPTEVFEKVTSGESAHRKIELRLTVSTPLEQQPSVPIGDENVGSFGVILPSTKPSEPQTEKGDSNEDNAEDNIITEEQLASNRIASKDFKTLPVFKNYSPGTPSCRLYIKNVAKQVVLADLHFIYRRYLPNNMEAELANMFDIRLMTEGRMKGQAFITLPTIQLAKQAVEETNGFILKEKPLVVQFARSAPATTAQSSSTEPSTSSH